MSAIDAQVAKRATVFDGWRSISISLYMTVIGYGVLVGIPVISTAWVNLLGFSEVEVGRVAGADFGGLSLGALIAATLIARVNRRLLVFGAVLLTIAANALCLVMVAYEEVSWFGLARPLLATLVCQALIVGMLIGGIDDTNIAASILAAGFGYDAVFSMCAAASFTAMSVYFFMYLRLKSKIPVLADAS